MIGSGVAASPLLAPLYARFQASRPVRASILTSRRSSSPLRPAMRSRPAEHTAQRAGASGCTRTPVIGCSAPRPYTSYTEATPREDGDAISANARRSWGKIHALERHPATGHEGASISSWAVRESGIGPGAQARRDAPMTDKDSRSASALSDSSSGAGPATTSVEERDVKLLGL
jgi:hypothetical protein